MQKARALIGATIVGLPLWCLLFFSLHATREIATVAAAGVGLAIFAVVATGTDARDAEADAAWREAAPDLPPASDRIALDRSLATMPGPDRGKRNGQRQRDERQGVHAGDAATPGAKPR